MIRQPILAAVTASIVLSSFAFADPNRIAPSADVTKPIEKGTAMPDAVVRDAEGNETTLKKLTDGKPTVLVFFRGGWCPICTRHAAQLIQAYPQIKAKGAQLVAISPDNPKSTRPRIRFRSRSIRIRI